jgi:hypothetical protein
MDFFSAEAFCCPDDALERSKIAPQQIKSAHARITPTARR